MTSSSSLPHFYKDASVPPVEDNPESILGTLKKSILLQLVHHIDFGDLLEEKHHFLLEKSIETTMKSLLQERSVSLSSREEHRLFLDIRDDLLGYGPISSLLNQEDITEIMVNGHREVYVEKGGHLHRTPITFRDEHHLLVLCQRIVSRVGRRVDETSPMCDARLPDGSRVNVVIPPLSRNGTCLTIRRFPQTSFTMDDCIARRTLTKPWANLLNFLVRARCNILVSGGTGSGKTTLLDTLLRSIPSHERVIICEDVSELTCPNHHMIGLETRVHNTEGKGEIPMRSLVHNCLRMRPDRIVIGEVRGVEAVDLLQSMNTGHEGSLGTLHANTPRDALNRIESMVMMSGYRWSEKAIRSMISRAVDLIVHISREQSGQRVVSHITEVLHMEGNAIATQDLMLLEHRDGSPVPVSCGVQRPYFLEKASRYNLEEEALKILTTTQTSQSDQHHD